MTERIRIEVDDDELEAVIARLDEAIIKKTELLGIETPGGVEDLVAMARMAEDEVEATVDRLTAEILASTGEIVAAVEASVQATVDRLTAEILVVEAEILGVEEKARTLAEHVRDLPQVDRATRMLLLRIPGLREVLRLLYIIKMEERTLRLGGMRGPLTAAVTIIMYLGMYLQSLQRRQEQLERRQRALEMEMKLRLVSVEEALRRTTNAPEKYRGGVPL